jgi:hypothetical protein
MKTKFKSKSEIISAIVKKMYPTNGIKRSLESRAIEKCGYNIPELLEMFENLK